MRADPVKDPIHETLELARRLTETVVDLLVPLQEGDPLLPEADDALSAAIDFVRAAGEQITRELRGMGEPVPPTLDLAALAQKLAGEEDSGGGKVISTAVAISREAEDTPTVTVRMTRPRLNPEWEAPRMNGTIDSYSTHLCSKHLRDLAGDNDGEDGSA